MQALVKHLHHGSYCSWLWHSLRQLCSAHLMEAEQGCEASNPEQPSHIASLHAHQAGCAGRSQHTAAL